MINISRKNYISSVDSLSTDILVSYLERIDVIRAIMKLSKIQRVIIVFYYILGFELRDVCVITNASPNNVYSQKSKAIKKIRSILNIV